MILNYNNYISERKKPIVENPIADAVIDNEGVIYNGIFTDIIIKGKKDKVNKNILGVNRERYPIGIDKSGTLIFFYKDNEDYALTKQGDRIPIPENIKDELKRKRGGIIEDYWKEGYGLYLSLTPPESTGWVNIKIDMEVFKRVKRYSKSIGTNTKGYESFLSKLKVFTEVSNLKREEQYIRRLGTSRIQQELSVIIMLQHLNEIKDFFNPSQAGFLFESFLSGLIPNSVAIDDNSSVDIKADDKKYQIKFISANTNEVYIVEDTIKDSQGVEFKEYLDYYILGLKEIDKIKIVCITKEAMESDESIVQYTTPKGDNEAKKKFIIRDLLRNQNIDKYEIDLMDIESKISRIGEDIKSHLDKLYTEISDFEYNLETIITGVNRKGDKIQSIDGLNLYYNKGNANINNLSNYLDNLINNLNR